MQIIFLALLCFAASYLNAAAAEPDQPNIIFILADDLGYGDVGCLNPQGKIATPNFDRLAREGLMLTDAHGGSAVCTPTRYGIMTGRYAWRSRLQSGVLGGLSPRLIESNRLTVADLLKSNGYHTACIGKWHLGMDWVKLPGKSVSELNIEKPEQVHNVDYAQPITQGPNSVGFDSYFGISASLDMVPYTFIQNDRVWMLPTEDRDFAMFLGRDKPRCRKGPAAPGFEVEHLLPELTKRAIAYVDERAAKAKSGKPFFLYLPLASPHTPIAPTSPWQGRSKLNAYADFVMETDEAVGKLLAALDRHQLSENTLVILTSDNGCSPQADFSELVSKGHNPSYVFRGHKADIYEGGHRIPLLARWPARVKAGGKSEQLACLTDFMATCAEITGAKLPDNAAEDSFSLLPALTGQSSAAIPADKIVRTSIVHHSINGSFAIREGNWKLCLCPGSGGWSSPRPGKDKDDQLPQVQLFDLAADIAETKNLQSDHPEIVQRLTALLEKYVADGRSTSGQQQPNTVTPVLWKSGR